MKRLHPDILNYYDTEVMKMISEKYAKTHIEALKMFTNSKTHRMLEDMKYGMTDFGAGALFNMWEVEKITGDPRNSVYIREETL